MNYARDLDDRRSTTSYLFTLGGGPICWKSMVQSLVALSTIVACMIGQLARYSTRWSSFAL